MGILLSSGVRPILLMNIKIYISALFNIAFFFFPQNVHGTVFEDSVIPIKGYNLLLTVGVPSSF